MLESKLHEIATDLASALELEIGDRVDRDEVHRMIEDSWEGVDWYDIVSGTGVTSQICETSDRVDDIEATLAEVLVKPEDRELLAGRVTKLEGIIEALSDSFLVIAMGLRGEASIDPAMARSVMDEAATLTPDNRVDGNGIKIADLEEVERELAE
jgi:hypothetical protein